MFKRVSVVCLAIALVGAATSAPAAELCSRAMAARTYPEREWAVHTPEEAGWSAAGVTAAMTRAQQSFSAGILVYRGRVIGQFGDVSAPHETRSMRKAFLGAIIGQLVANRRLRLDATLAEFRVDDVTPLNEVERSATVRDLLTSRSGVYLPAAYVVPGDEQNRPERGTHRPGETFLYWNWGFNALGGIVETVTGRTVFELFERRLARPLQLQDFSRERDTRYVREAVSRYPAYLFNLSARDRARLGLLYLNEGCWRGRQLVPTEWVRDSIAPHVDQSDDFDYGYLWWSSEPPPGSGLRGRLFMARGFANQYITGIPEIETLLVVSNDMARGQQAGLRPPRRSDYEAVLDLVLRARPTAAPSRGRQR